MLTSITISIITTIWPKFSINITITTQKVLLMIKLNTFKTNTTISLKLDPKRLRKQRENLQRKVNQNHQRRRLERSQLRKVRNQSHQRKLRKRLNIQMNLPTVIPLMIKKSKILRIQETQLLTMLVLSINGDKIGLKSIPEIIKEYKLVQHQDNSVMKLLMAILQMISNLINKAFMTEMVQLKRTISNSHQKIQMLVHIPAKDSKKLDHGGMKLNHYHKIKRIQTNCFFNQMMISIATLVHFQDKQTEDTKLNYQSTTSHKTISCQDLISLFQEITQTMVSETTHICKNILMISLTVIQLTTKISMTKVPT